MTPELRALFRARYEAAQAVNAAFAADSQATEEERAQARTALEAADQALIEGLETESRAPRELASEIRLANYLGAVAGEAELRGAEQELNREMGLASNVVPLEALAPLPEERADAVSPQDTDGNALAFGTVNQTTGPLLTRVFTATDAAFLGVAMPAVPPGERVYPVMTDGTTAAMAERSAAAADAGAAKFTVVNATPKRLSGRYVFDLEGVATLGTMLESTLRADLRTEMGYQLDRQILLGDGTGANVKGLLASLDLTLPPGAAFGSSALANDVSAVLAWATSKSLATDGLDGKYARSERDLRILIGGATYTLMRTLYRNDAAADDSDAIDIWTRLGVASRRSFQVPAPATATISPKTNASTKKVQSALVNSEPAAAVAPVWQGVTLIRDPYTNASKAEIVLTAHMLFDFVMRRTDGWHRYAIRTEA